MAGNKRPGNRLTTWNGLAEADRTTGVLPLKKVRAPSRKNAPEHEALKLRVDMYFAAHPEERMVRWRKEWRSISPSRAKATIRDLKMTVMKDTSRYLIAQQGDCIWFTVRPPAGEETREQAIAYEQYRASRGLIARENRGDDDDEDLDA